MTDAYIPVWACALSITEVQNTQHKYCACLRLYKTTDRVIECYSCVMQMLQMLRNVITVWYWYCILTHTVYGKQQYKTKTLTCWVCWSLAILLMRQCSLPCEEEGRYPWEEAWNPQSWLHQPAIQHHINWEQPSLLNRLKTWDCDDITSTLVGEREQANLVVQLTRLFTISIWVLHIPCNVLHNCVRFARTLPDTKVRHYSHGQ